MTDNVIAHHNTREEAIKNVKQMMLMNDIPGTTYVCRGLPVCAFTGIGQTDTQVTEELEHCQFCTRITLTIEGVLTEVTPDGPN